MAQINFWAHDVSCDSGRNPPLSGDALMGIACTDGDDQSWLEKQDFEKFLKKLQKLSPSIGVSEVKRDPCLSGYSRVCPYYARCR
jgi:hypothetical protein